MIGDLSFSKIINRNKTLAQKVLMLFVLMFFISDLITKIFIYFDASLNRFAGIIKLIFECIMLYYIIKKKEKHYALLLGLILFFAFLISNIISKSYFDYTVVITNIYYFNRYIYIYLFIVFIKSAKINFQDFQDFVKIFKNVIYVNSVLILIGYLFEIEFFRSYPYSLRFGYDGIFSKNGEAAYYYIFCISILYYEYVLNKKKRYLIKLIIISSISLLIGKKSILLFLFLLSITHVIFVMKKKKILFFSVISAIIGLIFFKNNIGRLIFKMFPFWENVYNRYGLLGTLTSKRSTMLTDFIDYMIHEWNTLNYLFGIGEYEKHKIEFEFFDVFMFFGLIGVFVFWLLFKKYFYNRSNRLSVCLLMNILITSFFSGALFISVTGMMFFYMVFQWINVLNNNQLNSELIE